MKDRQKRRQMEEIHFLLKCKKKQTVFNKRQKSVNISACLCFSAMEGKKS